LTAVRFTAVCEHLLTPGRPGEEDGRSGAEHGTKRACGAAKALADAVVWRLVAEYVAPTRGPHASPVGGRPAGQLAARCLPRLGPQRPLLSPVPHVGDDRHAPLGVKRPALGGTWTSPRGAGVGGGDPSGRARAGPGQRRQDGPQPSAAVFGSVDRAGFDRAAHSPRRRSGGSSAPATSRVSGSSPGRTADRCTRTLFGSGSTGLWRVSVAFTLSVYTHVLPGLDRAAADHVAALILGSGAPP